MSRQDLLLIGAGGHSHACIDAVESDGRFRIVGLVGAVGDPLVEHLGYPMLGNDADLERLAAGCRNAFVAVGHVRSPDPRMRLFERARSLGMMLPTIVSDRAYVSRHAQLGVGTLVMHGAVINAGARVGANCIVNSRALVEHDAEVGNHCHISTGAILNGGVKVGAGSFVGSGSVVREGVTIGQGCTVGMGLALRRSLPDHARFVGRIEIP